MLQSFDLGSEGIKYIRSRLVNNKALSTRLQGIPLEEGTVITHLPLKVEQKKIFDFSCGGLNKLGGQNEFLYRKIYEYLSQDEDESFSKYVIFEDQEADPDDKWIKREEPNYFYLGKDLYHFISDKEVKIDEIKRSMSLAYSHSLLGIMTALEHEYPLNKSQEVSDLVIRKLANNVKIIFVNAYDGEGYLIWAKNT